MIHFKKIVTLPLIVACGALFLCTCGPTIKDQTIHYGIGAGWYHEGKSSEEMLKDFDECQSRAKQNDNDPLIGNDCMRSKGYVLR